MSLSFTKIFKKSQDETESVQQPSVVHPATTALSQQANNGQTEKSAEQDKPVSCCGHCS